MWLRIARELVKTKILKLATQIAAFIGDIKQERDRKEMRWAQRQADWLRRLGQDLDASIGKMTYDEAFQKLGQPQLTVMDRGRPVAVWQSGRIKFKWYPIRSAELLRLFPHGSRLELTFTGETKLLCWKYLDW
jgi:hypothetical protein